jgi:hypothetical protein
VTPLGENFLFCLRYWAEFRRICFRRAVEDLGHPVDDQVRDAADEVYREATNEALNFLEKAGSAAMSCLTPLGHWKRKKKKKEGRYDLWQVRFEGGRVCDKSGHEVHLWTGVYIVMTGALIIPWIKVFNGGKAGRAILDSILAGCGVETDPSWNLKSDAAALACIPIRPEVYAEPLIQKVSAAFAHMADQSPTGQFS